MMFGMARIDIPEVQHGPVAAYNDTTRLQAYTLATGLCLSPNNTSHRPVVPIMTARACGAYNDSTGLWCL